MKQNLSPVKKTHFGIARKIVSNMTSESWESIPHAVVTYEPECSKFLSVVSEINKAATKETKLTINTIMLRVIVEGLKACPALNAHIDFNRKLVRGKITQFKEINISMPMLLNNGEMMTINLHNMHQKSISRMQDTIKDAQRRANNSDMNEVMYDVSFDNTIQGLKEGKILQTIHRLYGSKTGKHKVTVLKGEARKSIIQFLRKTGLQSMILNRERLQFPISAPSIGSGTAYARFLRLSLRRLLLSV